MDAASAPGRRRRAGGCVIAKRLLNATLPLLGIGLALVCWWAASRAVPDLPSPARTWEESRIYVMEPLTKRGEMDITAMTK